MTSDSGQAERRAPRRALRPLLAALAICALGFNLRPTSASVGPVLAELQHDLRMSAATTGLLTSLPVLAFAVFGATAPALARRFGLHRVAVSVLLCIATGLLARSLVDRPAPFLLLSLLALAGIATANVLLPSLVKVHFPMQVGALTAAYTTALAVGLTTASALTVPATERLGSWRWGLAVWALTALLAAIPWLGLLRRDTTAAGPSRTRLGSVARTQLGWAMAATFALQSTQAYSIFGWFAQLFRDAGYSPREAGLLLGTLTAVGIPVSFLVTVRASRTRNPSRFFRALVACYLVGYLGLLAAPTCAWIWSLLIGAGTSIFPLVLAHIGLRARTPDGTAALSGFTQSVGYLLAAPGPFAVGFLYNLTGGWTAPLLLLVTITLALAAALQLVIREQFIEDHLGDR